MNLYPLKFRPLLKQTIWGGEKIKTFKHLDAAPDHVGESWEISGVKGSESVIANGPLAGEKLPEAIGKYGSRLVGERVYKCFGDLFPLLIKFIDANADLSIQVHPDDSLAMKRHGTLGKTEMWYVLDTLPGAKIRSGFSRPVGKEEYLRLVEENRITDVINAFDSRPGDIYYLPAGRLHAICAGNFLVEIQETSDITYRVYDYNRLDKNGKPRELHTKEAVDAIDYTYYPDCYGGSTRGIAGDTRLVKSDYFDVTRLVIDGTEEVKAAPGSFTIIIPIEGEGTLEADGEKTAARAGESILVPAEISDFRLEGKMKALRVNL